MLESFEREGYISILEKPLSMLVVVQYYYIVSLGVVQIVKKGVVQKGCHFNQKLCILGVVKIVVCTEDELYRQDF